MLRECFIIYNSLVNESICFCRIGICQLTDLVLVVEKYRERGIKALGKYFSHDSKVFGYKISAIIIMAGVDYWPTAISETLIYISSSSEQKKLNNRRHSISKHFKQISFSVGHWSIVG
jgi:hypothetical protein